MDEVILNFCELVKIPSPSKHEENVINWIKEYAKKYEIPFKKDNYGNVILSVPATDKSKDSLALSAHMDVVGDDSPIEIKYDGDFIEANGRTLGADDKVGVSCALTLAKELINSGISHGGLEVAFTRDEESGMSGIENFDFNNLNSKYILVCDADKLGQLQVSGAGYTNARLEVKAFKGGHSGIDIADTTRPNAAKLLAEICSEIPQGVFYQDETGVITSINLGGISGGDVKVTNVLNTDGIATYSIRSANRDKEAELIEIMQNIAEKFNKKYENIASFSLTFSQHLPQFEKSDDELIPEVFKKVANRLNISAEISSFHAGAETHIYCQNKNAKGEMFIPFLVGLADIYNMHSSIERVNYKTLIKGYQLVKEFFIEFNK